MSDIEKLLDIMRRLRDPQHGCPWDVRQDFGDIAVYTVEEAYEVADAIAREDMTALREELGDLLFQPVFHARIAEERGLFDFNDVVDAICDKLVRRHPHVFGNERVESAEEQTRQWEAHKAHERDAEDTVTGVLDGVPLALPALRRAQKLQKRAATVGFDWSAPAPVIAKVREEIEELERGLEDPAVLREELGDLLFAIVNLARHTGVDAEAALRDANTKFEDRFRYIEERLAESGRAAVDVDLDTLENLWNEAKQRL